MGDGGGLVLIQLTKILADGDLDGLIAATVLKTVYPAAQVRFSHPAELRAGIHDDWIDKKTGLCDLPFHPRCGMYLDHHLTNRPSAEEQRVFEAEGGVCRWEDKPSAARVAYDLFCEDYDLSHLMPLMPMVDALDSGGITRQQFLSDDDIIWLSRTISNRYPEYIQSVLKWLVDGRKLSEIMKEEIVQEKVNVKRAANEKMLELMPKVGKIVNRLAVVHLENTGLSTNGYLVTAHYGAECDACLIIHGYTDGAINTPQRPALGASFYCNSFLHPAEGVMDLSQMATLLDPTGGGHANACGCRVQPLSPKGEIEDRDVCENDIELNLQKWLEVWNNNTQ
ncbi:MAG: hypothetical protein HOE92_02385 [Euryarchaeota archaeon]|nr:hypothetical protein [Euryarchaeota archaeon]